VFFLFILIGGLILWFVYQQHSLNSIAASPNSKPRSSTNNDKVDLKSNIIYEKKLSHNGKWEDVAILAHYPK